MKGMDFKGFRKVHEDDNHAVLEHPHGHRVLIAKKALSPNVKGQLSELKMADGGPVKRRDDVPEAPSKNAAAVQKGAMTPDTDIGSMVNNVKKAFGFTATPSNEKSYAEGGDVSSEMPVQQPDSAESIVRDAASPQPDAAAPQAPLAATDPALDAKRSLYNLAVGSQAGATADPSATDLAATMMFGKDGSAPENFNATAWKQAEQQFAQQQQAGAAKEQANAARVMEENKARAAAGVPTVPAPMTPASAPMGTPTSPGDSGQIPPSAAGAQPDIFGTEASSRATVQGLGLQQQGIQQQANAQSAQAAMQTKALQQSIDQKAKIAQDFQMHQQALTKEYDDSRRALSEQKIDFNRYWNDMSTASKVSTGIGILLSGMGAGLTGGPNLALDNLNRHIDNDIATQRAQLGQKNNLLDATMKQFGNLRDATDMTRALQQGALADQISLAASKNGGAVAQAQAKMAAGQLLEKAANTLGQISMRRTMMSGAQSGHIDPSVMLRAYGAPESAFKELKEAQDSVRSKDSALSGFDQLAKLNTVGNAAMSPWQNSSQVKGIRENLIASLSKATAGRFTEQDAGMLETLFPNKTDSAETIALKRERLNRLVSEKMNFPQLKQYGISPDSLSGSSYNSQGQSKFQLQPVVGRK